MEVIQVISGILTIGLGVLGILNSIFLWVPMFVQKHAVTGTTGTTNTVLRVAAGIIGLAVIAAGIALIVDAAS